MGKKNTTEKIRAFIAIELGDELRAGVADLAERLKKGIRFTGAQPSWTRPGAMHLTLNFLGAIRPEQVAPIAETMRRIGAETAPIDFSARGVGVFPHERRPRVLWVGIRRGADELVALQKRLEVQLQALGFAPEERAFTPHLTLARLKSNRGATGLVDVVKSHGRVYCGEARADRLVLFRSELHPDGARYTVLAEAPLPGAAPLTKFDSFAVSTSSTVSANHDHPLSEEKKMAQLKIGILASGGGTNFQAILDHIRAGELDAEIVMVVSNNSGAGALERARAAGIAWRHLSSATHPDPETLDCAIRDAMLEAGAQVVCLAGYMKMVGPRVLEAYRGRILNIHPALLPKHGGKGYYGIHVHEKVLESGDRVSGVTVHLVDERYDHGAILEQATVPVEADDTPESLQQRVLQEEHRIYSRVLRRIAAGELRLEGLES